LALLEAETVTSTLSTKDSPVPVTEAIPTLILTESKVAALVLPTRDISVLVVEIAALSEGTEDTPAPTADVDQTSAADPGPATPAEDRRCVILPVKDHSFDHKLQPGGMNMKNLFQGFRPPLVDPCRLSCWFQVTKLDPWMWRI
jgi:hypothetical protein